MSAYTDTGAWTCPHCGDTERGTSEHRRAQQRAHARRHTKDPSTVRDPEDVTPPARRKNARCAAEGCGRPYWPVHVDTAPGPTVQHVFLDDVAVPRAPKGARRGPRKRK